MRDTSLRLRALLGCCLVLACGSPGEPERPSILLVVVDTLRRDHLGAYGYERNTSPRLDRFAADALRYDAAQSQAPWTLPSVASLLTGIDARSLGIMEFKDVMGDELVLLPELLKEQGYVTGAIVSNIFLSARWGFEQGFDHFDESQVKGQRRRNTSPRLSNAAIAFLTEHRAEPFFLLLHYFDPHFRYREHRGFRFERDVPYEGPIHGSLSHHQLGSLRSELGPDDAAELARLYDSEIAFTDHHLGRVLEALRELGLYDRMLIAVTADHGEEFLERGRIGHGYTLHEELVGVPLIVRFPGGEPGVVSRPVAAIDLFPTILEVAGAPIPAGLDGVSLVNETDETDGAAAERFLFTSSTRGHDSRAVRSGRFKLVEHPNARAELYDLEADPLEKRNLFDEGRPELPRLADALDRYTERLQPERGSAGLSLSEEEREQLSDLGYLDDAEP